MPLLKNKSWYTMKATGKGSAEIQIYGDIGQPSMWNPDAISAKQFIADLKELGDVSNILIRINSYGGEIFDGNAIYNHLIEHRASKTVIVDGIAASMASVIAMAADKGKLKMPENAYLMIHDPSCGVLGTSDDMRKCADLLDGLKEGAIKAYQRHATNLTKEELWDLMKEETWVSAADAMTYGLAEEVIESVETIEPATNTGRAVPLNIKKILFQFKPVGPTMSANKGVDVMKCKHCGKEITNGVDFCSFCGKAQKDEVVNAALAAAHKKEQEEAVMEGVLAERNRVTEITARCKKHNLPEAFAAGLIDKNVSLEKAIPQILDEIEKKVTPITPETTVTKDVSDKLRDIAPKALLVSLGRVKDKATIDEVKKSSAPRDLHGLIRDCLSIEGRVTASEINRLTDTELGGHAIRMAAMGSSDLPSILADTMNREFMGGFEEAPTTFQEVCAETENPNFMTKSMTKLSGFSDIDEIPEGMNFKQGKFSDKKETIAVTTHGKMLTLTRQLIVNNDTAAISLFPRSMSAAMKRKMDRDFYNLLT
ncbi:MAG: ATP-dependent Clp protease proteolytic subunit, partial [Planctomycetes bacterium]|nr:ATP-dependent Clp protease proteolytic subunit [Planctomycetota bacterium]